MRSDDVRKLALALPEVEQYEHGDLPAFRVLGKRFATMLDDEGINLMLGEQGILAAVAAWPDACRAQRFAGRLASVRVAFGELPAAVVTDLVEEAWAVKAPKRLVRQRER